MDWSEFQETAERLAQGVTQGDWRSAISRGYYAVFHCFRELFLLHGLNLGRGGQSHFNLYVGLLNCGFPAAAALGRRIDTLRVERVRADYDLGAAVDQPLAQDCVRESRQVTRDFQTLLTTVSAVQITDGARQYLRSIGRLGPTP